MKLHNPNYTFRIGIYKILFFLLTILICISCEPKDSNIIKIKDYLLMNNVDSIKGWNRMNENRIKNSISRTIVSEQAKEIYGFSGIFIIDKLPSEDLSLEMDFLKRKSLINSKLNDELYFFPGKYTPSNSDSLPILPSLDLDLTALSDFISKDSNFYLLAQKITNKRKFSAGAYVNQENGHIVYWHINW